MKATLNRCVFRRDLKFPRDDVFLISAGNLFHKVGAATLNAQSPYDLSRDIVLYLNPLEGAPVVKWLELCATKPPGDWFGFC